MYVGRCCGVGIIVGFFRLSTFGSKQKHLLINRILLSLETMQDFQEVIEDSQLMNAMYDETPRPIQEWYHASQDEIEIYESKLRKRDINHMEVDFICSSALGFYLVSDHMMDSCF
jgi:hypothetical protein